ncbi:MAG: RNA polymerase sigma factor [Candidatus Omnitrophica bacterium]|nr:RNA polymerase sigma factor [Candidatus Omnitrophota bacterium]
MREITNDIILLASQGDLQSFEIIYKAMSGFVYNVALRIMNNREDAEEVTQEVFLTTYRKLQGFRLESSLKTWVYRITVNCAINFGRKKTVINNKIKTYDESAAEAMVEGDVQKEIEKEHTNKVVNNILSVLNLEQRVCVVLRNIEGLSYEEIAEALNININTVRSRLKRAREKILSLRKQVDYEYL